jgi:magnesium transporter
MDRPWEALASVIASGDPRILESLLERLGPTETARSISRLDHDDLTALFDLLDAPEAADVLEGIPEANAVGVIEELPARHAAAILDEMPSDKQADLISGLEVNEAEAILDEMPAEDAADLRELMAYDPETAGGVMLKEYVYYLQTLTVGEVMEDLRTRAEEISDYDIQYVYVVDREAALQGVLRLRDLLFARWTEPVTTIMLPNPIGVDVGMHLAELNDVFDRHSFMGLPVTERGRLVGVIRRDDVHDAIDKESNRTFLRLSGISGGEELRSMPWYLRARRRLSWLSINVLLNLMAASVIALYQETLAEAVVLAVFLPIISDMSGCSGNQAAAVSLRELSLGLVKPAELGHVALKEVSVGILNGLALGLLLAVAALLWQGNPFLGLVVGVSLAVNTIIAVILGGLLPLLLRRGNFDPAIASGPILTTVTDMCGFLLLLSLATAVLPMLK